MKYCATATIALLALLHVGSSSAILAQEDGSGIPRHLRQCTTNDECIVLTQGHSCIDWFYPINESRRLEYEKWMEKLLDGKGGLDCFSTRDLLRQYMTEEECEKRVIATRRCSSAICTVEDWQSVCFPPAVAEKLKQQRINSLRHTTKEDSKRMFLINPKTGKKVEYELVDGKWKMVK